MTLLPLIRTSPLTVLGINTGTSADGLDLTALEIRHRAGRITACFLKHTAHTFQPDLAQRIRALAEAPSVSLDEIIYLDNYLGTVIGEVATRTIRSWKKSGIVVQAIASHGQTVRHRPQKIKLGSIRVNGTLQIGHLERVAASTGLVTIGDFRQADVALGNEGAPITVAAMQQLFADRQESRLIVNIGGMSNFFYFPSARSGRVPLAADCGPGNSLSDALMHLLFRQPFDRGGQQAAQGVPSERLLTTLLALPFYRSTIRSTGREQFGNVQAEQMIAMGRDMGLKKADLLATAVELTARSIAMAVGPILEHDADTCRLHVMGGGSRNHYLLHRLRQYVPECTISSIDDLGYPASSVEAAAYAVMGYACLKSIPLRTRFDGKKQPILPILGKIVQPPQRV